MMVRLVKGAYWDTEVKRAQERGLADYPVFTRKAATDQSYLACARRLLAARPRLYPQFATHNALTVATILEMAGGAEGFEFQRLHGMGEALYEAVTADAPAVACRIYAPVGGHRELLRLPRAAAPGERRQLVLRRDRRRQGIPVERLLRRPAALLDGGARVRHGRIPFPADLYAPARRNSRGMEFGNAAELGRSSPASRAPGRRRSARGQSVPVHRRRRGAPVVSPVDGKDRREVSRNARSDRSTRSWRRGESGFAGWSRDAVERAAALDRLSDLLEADRDGLVALMAREGGKTLVDGVAEVREAVDFCRYYAAQARRLFAEDEVMPGPTGESDRLVRRGRGVFVCISPWNFPLAIFLGQVTAALAAGNAVVAKPAEQTPLIARAPSICCIAPACPSPAAQLAPATARSARRWSRIRRSPASPSPARPKSRGRSTARWPRSAARSCRSSPRPAASTP